MLKNNFKNDWLFETFVLNSCSVMKQSFTTMGKVPKVIGEMKQQQLTFRDYKYHTENPFIGDVIEQISEKRFRKAIGSKYQQVLNENTGELENQKVLVLGEQKNVDKQEFYKVYYGAIKNFFALSKNTMKLFEYIMANITYSHDRICIMPGDVLEKTGISRTGCYRAILQLLEINIIAKADVEGCYFINPTIAFKGDRITLMKQYILNKEREVGDVPGKKMLNSEQKSNGAIANQAD